MILPEAQLYGRNVIEKPAHRENILKGTGYTVDKVQGDPKRL